MGGLRRLEYRGYDSAGVVTVHEGKLQRARSVGPLRALEQRARGGLPGTIGIGHTRWATHGGVTEENCHPHLDARERVAVVHNGIIDNAEALRAELSAKGMVFKSETDSEVIPELVARALDDGMSLCDAVRHALKRIEGTAGILVLDREDPSRLIAARIGSPVVIGLGEGACWVASDQLALRPYTYRIIVLEDGELAELSANGVRTVDLDARERDKRIEKIMEKPEDAERGAYPHFMLKEIHEQPLALDRSLRGRLDAALGSSRLGGLTGQEERLLAVDRVLFFASGASLYTGQVGAYLMNRYARLPAHAEDAAELLAHNPIVEKRTLYVAISQSGETGDTLATLRELRLRGALVMGITNVAGSSLARETEFGVYIHAGPEISVSSTKAFTAQILACELLALRCARLRDLGASEGRAWVNGLMQLPRLVGAMLELAPQCERLAQRFRSAPFIMYVGRGSTLPIALEGALKLKEIAYLPAEGLSGAAMKHGPLALIERGTPCWALVPPDETRERMIGNLRELAARGAHIIAVADHDDREVASIAAELVPLPPHHPAIAPILSVIPLQLYAYHAALARGHDIDKPRNLAKSVTVM
jgi:glucosamine--fructose-6-phosphate aminotransferase (isomerizing)